MLYLNIICLTAKETKVKVIKKGKTLVAFNAIGVCWYWTNIILAFFFLVHLKFVDIVDKTFLRQQ